MDKYKIEVRMLVEVEAFDYGDALTAVEEAYGTGEELGFSIVECQYVQLTDDAELD